MELSYDNVSIMQYARPVTSHHSASPMSIMTFPFRIKLGCGDMEGQHVTYELVWLKYISHHNIVVYVYFSSYIVVNLYFSSHIVCLMCISHHNIVWFMCISHHILCGLCVFLICHPCREAMRVGFGDE